MFRKRYFILAVVSAMACALAVSAGGFMQTQVQSTLIDFFQPGSQPNSDVVYEDFRTSDNCKLCHTTDFDGADIAIYNSWQGSMMAQAARDPLFEACLAIANQDAAFSGDLCIRCHAAGGWISGRSDPTDGSALTEADRDGVSCSVCHRLVDPDFKPGVSPPIDANILANIDPLPISPGGGNYVLDPQDLRRGPFSNPIQPQHPWLHSPFHQTADLCGTCHDVNNPMYLRQPDDTYALTELDEPHPTADKYDMFPIERTYSEWLNSEYATTGVDAEGRFGGNLPTTIVSTCQDCHMPDVESRGCNGEFVAVREDMPAHEFAGGNAWVQDMVLNLYPDSNIVPANLEAGKQRSISMLQRAATLEVTQNGFDVNVRIINETGHKLPSGYPEGRRMWINVQQFDAEDFLIAESGEYNELTADLVTENTKVYETTLGIDAAVAQVTGIPEGVTFHFALNNTIYKDNRIPPRGFTNAAFEAIQAKPVAATYADGQYWNDTLYTFEPDATSVTVSLYYQTTSKEYVEFLRDENVTNDAGDILYDQWEITGKSPPVQMATMTIELATADYDEDGDVDLDDYAEFFLCDAPDGVAYPYPDCIVFDADGDGDVDARDFGYLQGRFGL